MYFRLVQYAVRIPLKNVLALGQESQTTYDELLVKKLNELSLLSHIVGNSQVTNSAQEFSVA